MVVFQAAAYGKCVAPRMETLKQHECANEFAALMACWRAAFRNNRNRLKK